MPKRANAGTVPASSTTIKAMSTFGHFHLRWKWGILNIVRVAGLGQPRGTKGRGGWRREERSNVALAAVVGSRRRAGR
jgi:hypothetical protein